MAEARSAAAGDLRAIHRPPAAPKHFCGAKKYTSNSAALTGTPPAALVASTRIRAPGSAPAIRGIAMATPVEGSLWVSAEASTPASACGRGGVPGSEAIRLGAASHGPAAEAAAHFVESAADDRGRPI